MTTMNLPVWATSLLIVLLLLHLLLLLSASSPPRGMFFEDNTRLGSTPPSCHNKCNECHPCMAVQVPSMPGRAGRLDSPSALPMGFFDSSPQGNNRYSFYKPLGWKCRCGNHFFNP